MRHGHDRYSCWNVFVLTLPVRYPVFTWTPAEVSEIKIVFNVENRYCVIEGRKC